MSPFSCEWIVCTVLSLLSIEGVGCIPGNVSGLLDWRCCSSREWEGVCVHLSSLNVLIMNTIFCFLVRKPVDNNSVCALVTPGASNEEFTLWIFISPAAVSSHPMNAFWLSIRTENQSKGGGWIIPACVWRIIIQLIYSLITRTYSELWCEFFFLYITLF